jgi:hypothetical protein
MVNSSVITAKNVTSRPSNYKLPELRVLTSLQISKLFPREEKKRASVEESSWKMAIPRP